MHHRCLSLLVGLAVAGASGLSAQHPDSAAQRPARGARAGRVIGVYDQLTGDPILGAAVIDLASGDQVTTSATGTASLAFVRTPTAFIEIRKLGFRPWYAMVDVTVHEPLTIVLDRFTVLDTVVSSARMNVNADAGLRSGFDRRCRAPGVTCVRDSQFADAGGRSIGDFLKRTPGMANGLQMKGPFGTCTPTFYVDGLQWDTRDFGYPIGIPGAPQSNAPFLPSNVTGVEIYPFTAQRPMRFMGNPSCGAIVIWTK